MATSMKLPIDPLWYVKLNKDQVPVEVNPRELNQPIEVPQV